MNCKPGDLAVVVRNGIGEFEKKLVGNIRKVLVIEMNNRFGAACWSYEGERLHNELGEVILALPDSHLRPIRDQPGNEQFVTEARKKLKPTEITERGEVA